jgi:hypothetical protein
VVADITTSQEVKADHQITGVVLSPKLTADHRNLLASKYGIPEDRITAWQNSGVVKSVDKFEATTLTKRGLATLPSGGILFTYLGSEAIVVRLDTPLVDANGKEKRKYIYPTGQPCALFNPGVDLTLSPEIWITEGVAKSMCGFDHGLPVVALGGLWNWKNHVNGNKVSDADGLLPELSFDWTGKKAVLLTDSDIIPSHPAYDAFPRLAEQLCRLGAEEVRVLALPNLTPNSQKTGLDEFIIAKGDQAVTELRAWVDSKEPQHNWRRDIKELGELAEKSTKDGEGFDVELPFTTRMLDALAHDYRDKNTFGNIFTTLTKAKPKPSITELKQRVKDQLKLLAAKKIRIVDPAQQKPQKPLDPAYDVPLKLLEGTNYQIIDKAMWKIVIKESKNSKGETVRNIDATPICHFVIWPVRKIQKSDGAYLELEGILPNGIPMKRVVITMKDCHKMEWLGPAWHIGAEAVESGKEKELRNCLGMMGQNANIQEVTIYTKTGWEKVDGRRIYCKSEI